MDNRAFEVARTTDELLGLAFGHQVIAIALTRIECANLHETPHSGLPAGADELLHQFHVHLAETRAFATCFVEYPDHVDGGVCTLQMRLQNIGVMNIRLSKLDAGDQGEVPASELVTAQDDTLMTSSG